MHVTSLVAAALGVRGLVLLLCRDTGPKSRLRRPTPL